MRHRNAQHGQAVGGHHANVIARRVEEIAERDEQAARQQDMSNSSAPMTVSPATARTARPGFTLTVPPCERPAVIVE